MSSTPAVSDDDQRILSQWKDNVESAFQPSPEEVAFLQATTRIQDEEELKAHVVAVQHKALQVYPYPCILKFAFTQTKISKLRGYKETLQLAKNRPGALMLEVGCCVGADTRKAVLDGFPASQIVASDLHAKFWDIGHEMFRDDKASMPITFLAGDVFDPAFLSPDTTASTAPLSALTSLTQLHGRLSSIHASHFLHLFPREGQAKLSSLLAGLLLQEKGSVIFGHQVGAEKEGLGQQFGKWAYNRESCRTLWEAALASVGWTGKADIYAELVEAPDFVQSVGIGTHFLYCAGIGKPYLSWCMELLCTD
ncbi:hypothetical protein CALVIDRAFT_529342 [Calocera viscosa TUFC12733]|uniref:Methyltransferase domain-containing protein n=1 Tax=Calocera viscosa (strain TUFC12733) TaxID=1330018 RepID=A0A167JHV5_CALVF|nr:hypothetical protein CALVIDRAFT_529342 [Calocera viscosa TUFC12733]